MDPLRFCNPEPPPAGEVDSLFVDREYELQDTYWRHDKVFDLATPVSPFDTIAPLMEIYDQHVGQFHDNKAPFPRNYVEDAARRCDGRVGLFLRHLHWIRLLGRMPDPAARVIDQVAWELGKLSRENPALAEIVRLVATLGGDVTGDHLKTLRSGAGARFLVEDYTSEPRARLDPM